SGGNGGSTGAAQDGDAGAGGTAGFGGGVGSDGDGNGGGGGSGYGGALFVRSGGTLVIAGNALFQNNGALAGSSNNGGVAGNAAGTDLFMMKGSNVTLSPGAGNVIRFEGTIADDSASSYAGASYASGSGANLQITGGGLVQLLGENTYSGTTYIGGATLDAADGVGLNRNSHLTFNGGGTIGNLSPENAGVWLASGTVNRRVGSLPTQMSWAGSGGFAAATTDGLTLNFGALSSSTGQMLQWNAGGFVTAGSTLVFGSEYGLGAVKLVNAVDMNGLVGRIAVYDNQAVDTDYAVLAGRFSNGGLIVNDTGYTGAAYFTAQNSLSSLVVNGGLVSTRADSGAGRLMNGATGGALVVNGGKVELYGAEKLTTADIAAAGTLVAYDAIDANTITNAGAVVGYGDAVVGTLTNLATGQAAFYGQLGSIGISNAGLLVLGGAVNAQTIANLSGGQVVTVGDVTAAASVNNAGLWTLGGTLTAPDVVQDGFLAVMGDIGAASETAATRTIHMASFSGGANGIVGLGGVSGTVANTLVIDQSGDSLYSGIFDGAGNLVKSGAGTLNLTGANSFTGALTVADGGLDTTGGGTFADAVAIGVDAPAVFTIGADNAIAALSNAGTTHIRAASSMSKLGNSGQLDLTGTLAVTGIATNDKGGRFTVAQNASADLGHLVNAGALENEGALSVSGGFVNASTGTVTLGAPSANTFGSLANSGAIKASANVTVQGDYVQNAGSFKTTANLTTGSLSGTGGTISLAANSVLTINQTTDGTYGGSIAGGGGSSMVKTGAGTLTLNGQAGSFAPGALYITLGTVALDGANILSTALQVDIGRNGGLTLVQGDQTINNLTGTGILALNGNNLYLANGGNFAGTVTGNGNVKLTTGSFDLNDKVTSQDGNFQVDAGSELNVRAGGILTAPTVDVTGMLNVAGSVSAATTNVTNGGTLHLGGGAGAPGGALNTSTLIVNGGGRLTGNGNVSGSTMIGGSSAGMLSPGNSPGTMTFADLTLDANSVTEMQIEGAAGAGLSTADGGYDQITVTGKMAIKPGSTLTIANATDFELALGQKVTIFEAAPGAVSGTFGTVTSEFDNAVALNLSTGSVIGLGSYTPDTFVSTAAVTPNQLAMLDQLRVNRTGGVDQYRGGRLVEYVAGALATGDRNAVSAVFSRASPEAYAGLIDQERESMLNNLADLGGYGGLRDGAVYAIGSFGYDEIESRKNADYARFKSTDRRFNIGVAAELPVAKIQFSYSRSNGKVLSDYLRGSANGDLFSLGASAPFALNGALRVMARASYGDYHFSGTRVTNGGNATFGGVKGHSAVLGGGLEYFRTSNKASIDVSAEVLQVLGRVNGFTETGATPFDALTIGRQRDDVAVLRARLTGGYALRPNWQGFVRLGVDQELSDSMLNVTANVVSEDVDFTVRNPGVTHTRARFGLGSRVDLNSRMAWTVEGDVGNASSYGARTSMAIRF
ncbi:MAG: autotransporter-associated beta strand repeat-containing protein, partial [Sphingomonas bacterium]